MLVNQSAFKTQSCNVKANQQKPQQDVAFEGRFLGLTWGNDSTPINVRKRQAMSRDMGLPPAYRQAWGLGFVETGYLAEDEKEEIDLIIREDEKHARRDDRDYADWERKTRKGATQVSYDQFHRTRERRRGYID